MRDRQHVRYWPIADIVFALPDVRFREQSGHGSVLFEYPPLTRRRHSSNWREVYSNRRVISSTGLPVTFVEQLSPDLTGIAGVSVPVEMISPALNAELSVLFASDSTK